MHRIRTHRSIITLAVAAGLSLASCGGGAAAPAADSSATSIPASQPGTITDSTLSPSSTTADPVATAPAPTSDECYGAFSAALASEIATKAADPVWTEIEPSQDTSRGVVVCYQQFYSAPEASIGDTDVYLGVTLSDSSRYVDGIGSTVTIDTYKAFADGAIPMTFGDDSIAWGAAFDTEYKHYRYIAFAKGDLVVMVYAGFAPYAAPADWATADGLLEQWVTELASRLDASALVATDLPPQEAVVAVTTAPQG